MIYVLDKFRICRDMDFEHQGAIVGLMKDVLTYLQKDVITSYSIHYTKLYESYLFASM